METFFRGWVDNILIVASWVERLTEELGLTNVSQIWSERPGWYLWFKDAPGVHALELLETERLGADGSGPAQGRFGIKFYPDPADPLFTCFSPQERELVLGPNFDHLHTPSVEAQHLIPDHLFQVGMLEVTADEDGDWALISLAALDQRTSRAAGGVNLGQVPAWSLAYGLLQPLLGLFAFSSKNRPARIALTREPGFAAVHHPDGEINLEPAPESRLNCLSLVFCPDPEQIPSAVRAEMDRALAEDPLCTVFDLGFGCGHLHEDHLDPNQRGFIDHAWWKYAGVDYKSNLASSCGCEH